MWCIFRLSSYSLGTWMLRIKNAMPLGGYSLRLLLTDGTTVERDIGALLVGPVFDGVRNNPELFNQVRVRRGTLWWPGDVDLCPDVVLGNLPPDELALL